MPSPFKQIGIMARIQKSGVKETLTGLCAYLRNQNYSFFIEKNAGIHIQEDPSLFCNQNDFNSRVDLLIVIGGDGSMLKAIHVTRNTNIGVLGINRGNLGFLTDIHPAELYKIGDILQGHYVLEERFMLHTSIEFEHQIVNECISLNEIALLPDMSTRINDFEIYIDERFVCNLRADGLIATTPTGSTAYSLSGGGPILHPHLPALALIPIFPHTLSMRPIVISNESHVRIHMPKNAKSSLKIAFDGHRALPISQGTNVLIKKNAGTLRLIHPLDYDYYDTLRNKLNWGQRLPAP